MKKTTLIAAASLLAVTLGWALRENLAPVDPGAGVDTAVRPAESLLDVDVDAGGEAPAPSPVATSGPESSERVTVETAAAPAPAATEAQVESPAPTGSLLVKITERGTGLPAKNVAVSTLLGSENGDGGWMPWALSQRRVTDAEGRAFFGELPTQELTVYLHRVGGGGDFDAEGATIVAGDTVTVEFTVDETQRAHGRVVDETNRGVEGARIWLDDGGGPASTDGAFVASSGPDGRFEVPYAGPLQSLIAVKPGYAPSLSTVMSVHDNAEVDGITLVLPTRRGRVFGKVLDANGRPAPGVRVVLETENSSVNDPETGEWTGFWTTAPVLQRSGEDGSFDFEDVGVGSYQLLARVPGGARTALACDVTDGGNHELALRLRRGGIVRGTVTGEDGGPVEAATIRVVQGQDLSLSRQETATDAEGNYELRGVPSGDVELALEGSDYVSRSKETIHVTDGQTTLWNPVVRAPARLRGTLRSSAGEPLAQWRISTAGRWHATDSSGTFDFAVETRDSYTIEVRIPGMLFGDPLLSVPDAALEDGPFDLAIPAAEVPSGSVVGRVVTSDGSPWSGEVRLTLNTEGVFFQQIDTDEDGRFAFGNVPPASGKLELQNTAPAMDPVPVAVEAAMAADLGEIVIGGAE